MARNKDKMPTIAEAGPIGARKTRAVAGGYRKKVGEIQKGRAAKHERLTGEATRENERRAAARSAELGALDQSISTLETAMAKKGISSFVLESLEEQLVIERARREELSSQPLELVDLPPKDGRIIANKEEVFEEVEQEASKRDALAHELVDLAYEKIDAYTSAAGLGMGSARAIDRIYIKPHQDGGFDGLLFKQYVSNPEILPAPVRETIKSHLEQVINNKIEAELAEVGNLGEATLQSLRKKLQERYRAPEKIKEVIASIPASPEKSVLAGYSIEQPLADLLLREAAAQGADPLDLARLIKISDRSIRDDLGFRGVDQRVEPLLEAVKFFSRYMQDGDIYGHRFPLRDPQVRPIIEAVLGREIELEGAGTIAENLKNGLVEYAKTVERGAQEMVRVAKERGEYKNKVEEVQAEVAEVARLGKERLAALIDKEQTEARGLMEAGREKVSDARERTVQLEHKLSKGGDQAQELIESVKSASPDDFAELAKKVAEAVKTLETQLADGRINDEYYRALTANLSNAYDTGYNNYLLAKAVDAYFIQEGQPGVYRLLGDDDTARHYQSPEMSSTVRRVEIALDDAVRKLPDREVIPRLFKGQGRTDIAQERLDIASVRDTLLRGVTSDRDTALSSLRSEIRGSNMRQEVRELLEQKLRVAQMASDRLSRLDRELNYLRQDKFKPIYDRLRQERTELDGKRQKAEREKHSIELRIDEFESSAMRIFSGLGAGGADRKALEKVNQELAEISKQIEANRSQSSKLSDVFDSMNPIQQQVARAQRDVFPSTVKR